MSNHDIRREVLTLGNNNLINEKMTIFTASGIFSGTITHVEDGEKGSSYELEDVIYRPSGNFDYAIKMNYVTIISDHICAFREYIEPVKISPNQSLT